MKSIQGENIYFIGIGGVSMSGLALVLNHRGYRVQGSDRERFETAADLESRGIQINYGHARENITKSIDLIVYTAAIKEDNPELAQGRELGITAITRAELLGILINEYKNSVCVAGTHGKTTTTSMIAHLLLELGLSPTVSLGAFMEKIGGNFRLGDNEYFIVESCEYNDSFLSFSPNIGVILNIDYDHTDFYPNLESLEASFKKFAENTKDYLIINKNIKNFDKITGSTTAEIIPFGGEVPDFTIPLIGEHSKENALAAKSVTEALGLEFNQSLFDNYKSPYRRFEIKGENSQNILVIDDYAHHPTEVKATLKAVKEAYPNRKIYCLFQPHTYTRTKSFLDDFAEAFVLADVLILMDIFAAREPDTGMVSTKDLYVKIVKPRETYYLPTEEPVDGIVEKFLEKKLKKDSLLITMGATKVGLAGDLVLKK